MLAALLEHLDSSLTFTMLRSALQLQEHADSLAQVPCTVLSRLSTRRRRTCFGMLRLSGHQNSDAHQLDKNACSACT